MGFFLDQYVKADVVTLVLGKVERRAVYLYPRFSCTLGELAILVALTIVTVALFPSTQGPYSVTNGPATAFRAAKSAATSHSSIVQAAKQHVLNPIAPPLPAVAEHVLEIESHAQYLGKYAPILRC